MSIREKKKKELGLHSPQVKNLPFPLEFVVWVSHVSHPKCLINFLLKMKVKNKYFMEMYARPQQVWIELSSNNDGFRTMAA